MVWRLVTLAAIAALAQGAERAGPSDFYVVSETFSDYGPQFNHYILDVKGDGSDSVIRFARVAVVGLFCPRVMIQSAQATVRHQSPAQLVARNNPCAVQPPALRAALSTYGAEDAVFESTSFGIVVQCGASAISLTLPVTQSVNMKPLRKAAPAIARLWDLASEITDRAFGPDNIFSNRSEADDLALQRAGEKFVPELRSGRFDAGLSAAVEGNVGSGKQPTFRSLLERYAGPVSAPDQKPTPVPTLLNAPDYRFSHFVAPVYPRLARLARIEGRVMLGLTVRAATGEVEAAAVLSGHPLLARLQPTPRNNGASRRTPSISERRT